MVKDNYDIGSNGMIIPAPPEPLDEDELYDPAGYGLAAPVAPAGWCGNANPHGPHTLSEEESCPGVPVAPVKEPEKHYNRCGNNCACYEAGFDAGFDNARHYE